MIRARPSTLISTISTVEAFRALTKVESQCEIAAHMSADSVFQTVVFCDGACSGNPGPGGWAAIVATPGGLVRELGGGQSKTTNNQMELQAATEGLKLATQLDQSVVLYTDSVYVIRGITQWIWGWMKRDWQTAEGKPVLNREYWQELAQVVSARRTRKLTTEWKYVRGHTGVPGNERCDEIAVAYAKGFQTHLYNGPLLSYEHAIFDLPPDDGLPDQRENKGADGKREKKAAHSYLSLVGGQPMRHMTWTECERRVKGQAGAKFKKSASADDEIAILKSWGVDPSRLK